MDGERVLTLDLSAARHGLAGAYERVVVRHDRVEITDSCDQTGCVLISKAELDSLDQALEIMAASDSFGLMAREIRQVAVRCSTSDLAPSKVD